MKLIFLLASKGGKLRRGKIEEFQGKQNVFFHVSCDVAQTKAEVAQCKKKIKLR